MEPRTKKTQNGLSLCSKGETLKHEWVMSVQNAPKDDWQRYFFADSKFHKHLKKCEQCYNYYHRPF